MRTNSLRDPSCLRSVVIAMLLIVGSLAMSSDVHAQAKADARTEAQGPSLGAHTLLWQEQGHGANPAVTKPIDTQTSSSSLIAFSAGWASNSNPPTDNKSNTWTQLGPRVFYRGYQDRFDVKAYIVNSARGGPGHIVSIVKGADRSDGEITIPFIEIKNANLHEYVQNYPDAGATATSGSVTTSGPATLVAVWWGDGNFLDNSATPDNGFTLIEHILELPPDSAVQCAVAYKQVASAGSYNVTWAQSPSQGAVLWLFAFQAGAEIFRNGFE